MHSYRCLAAVFFILFAFESAYACFCATPGPPCDYYATTEAIFLGRVIGSAERKTHTDEKGKTVYDIGMVRFLVQENYKGAPGYEIEVDAGKGGGDCGYPFLRNESYVVYAYRDARNSLLSTGLCTRTKHVSAATEDLQYLRGLANAKPGATLYGELTRFIGDPEWGPVEEGPKLAGVKVIITGAGRTTETLTNAAGQYRVTGLPPGDYDAFPQLPENLGAVSDRDKQDDLLRFAGRDPVRLIDGSCGRMNFTVQFSGVVSGKVVDAKGEPAKEVQLTLVANDNDDREWWTWTDKDGQYEFHMVQPGSYLLGFNIIWAPDSEDPYPKTFYPGVKTRAEASLITVGEGEKLKGYDLMLPPRLRERPLNVTVVWADGSPAANVQVTYQMNEAKSMGQKINTQEKGTAVLSLFANHYYIIYAHNGRDDKQLHSRPIEVFVDKKLKSLRLVLDKAGFGYDEIEALKRKSPK